VKVKLDPREKSGHIGLEGALRLDESFYVHLASLLAEVVLQEAFEAPEDGPFSADVLFGSVLQD